MYQHKDNQSEDGGVMDFDEPYEFSGSTLKINKDVDNPAVMTGVDSLSPSSAGESTNINETTRRGTNDPDIIQQSATQQSDAIATANSIRPRIGSPRHFFSFRSGLFEQAIEDCQRILLEPGNDNEICGSWLLTEISHWDHERERIVVLTKRTLLTVKYDFIAMRILENKKIKLNILDTVVRGPLTYPTTSLVPRLEGLANGISTIISGTNYQNFNQANSYRLDITSFRPLTRNEIGVRVMWNKGKPISMFTSWNPLATEIPWKTFTNHPLFTYKDTFNVGTNQELNEELETRRPYYSVEKFHDILKELILDPYIERDNRNYQCEFEDGQIVLNNYVNVGAMVHNKNNFGFFKVRGKFSF